MNIILEFLVVLLAIVIGARKGGLFLGAIGGLGLFILVFGFGMKPANPPIDVMLIIVAVITAAATMQAAGGIDLMVRIAEKLLRAKPSAVTIVAPIVSYVFTFLSGTGHVGYAILPIINDVAIGAKVRPERPLTISVIAGQQAITASPISAATAALLAMLTTDYNTGLQLSDILIICIPATIIGVLIAAFIQIYVGKDLEKDPEYIRRVKEGLIQSSTETKEKLPKGASLSVWLFLSGVVLIVLFGSIPYLKEMMKDLEVKMPNLIELVMLSVSTLIVLFTKVNVSKIIKVDVFGAGMAAVVAIFGIAWMGDTFFQGNLDFFKGEISEIVTSHPWMFSIALFVMSVMLFSQAATIKALMPLGFALGIPPAMLIGMFPSVNGYFFIPNYPTVLAAINFDKTGSTRIGKYVLNHSFQLPGMVATISSIAIGLIIAKTIY